MLLTVIEFVFVTVQVFAPVCTDVTTEPVIPVPVKVIPALTNPLVTVPTVSVVDDIDPVNEHEIEVLPS
jgi:hypothetical protein